MTSAYIALGSNLGDPQRQLCNAVNALQLLPETRLERVSSVYRSAAIGPGIQPDYLNAAALLHTGLTALALLDALQQIEAEQDRVRNLQWGPRTIDLDLLLYGNATITSSRLTVPHPRMPQRNFVLYPLREISRDGLLMPDGTKLGALLERCSEDGLVKTHLQLSAHTPTHCQ